MTMLTKITTISFYLLLSILCIQASEIGSSNSTNSTTPCKENERNALIMFKQGFNDLSGRLSSWVGNDCCSWPGIGCSQKTGHVTKLDLRNTAGAHYFETYNETLWLTFLSGTINPSLLELKRLKYLDLSLNYFYQTPIPNFIGSFTKLKYLNLSRAYFGGMIPPHLGNLSNLKSLDLSGLMSTQPFQYISVSDLNWISKLHSLEHLNLATVNLSLSSTNWLQAINTLPSLIELDLSLCNLRVLPQSLPVFNLSHVEIIHIRDNYFPPSQLPSWLFNMSRLKTVNFQSNGLIGQILPLENLRNLTFLNLANNSLSGSLPPSVGNLSLLEVLVLGLNYLNGTIPPSIGQLEKLTTLDLGGNKWEGVVSRIHFLHLENLKYFRLSSDIGNKSLAFNVGDDWVPPFSLKEIVIVNCQMDLKFPSWLQTQKELTYIMLEEVGISGNVPDWFWNQTSRVKTLYINHNNLSGQLPRSMLLANYSWVDLSFNAFDGPLPFIPGVHYMISLRNNLLSGPIPFDFALVMNVGILDLSGNYLNGTIPNSILTLRGMDVLALANNQLSGNIPSLKNMVNLYALELSNNNLSGEIPESLCTNHRLSYLKLKGNNLYGQLSPLRNCRALSELDLADNKLSGEIPGWIGEAVFHLSILKLRGNMFDGEISENLCRLPYLHVLDLGLNNLSGRIPSCIGNLSSFFELRPYSPTQREANYLYFYHWDEMELASKGQTRDFTFTTLFVQNLIDLSGNNLEGEIPDEITNLSALTTLNLSQNQLTGGISEKFGTLKLLESLDLSDNKLSGPIPTTMTSMTSLSHLNLSYNDLSGSIPTANQFQTFDDPSLFEGNPKLCGAPLTVNCSSHSNEHPPGLKIDENESELIMRWFYIGLPCGFAAGFWTVCVTLIIKRSWRHAYFRFMDDMKDKIYIFFVMKATWFQKKLVEERN